MCKASISSLKRLESSSANRVWYSTTNLSFPFASTIVASNQAPLNPSSSLLTSTVAPWPNSSGFAASLDSSGFAASLDSSGFAASLDSSFSCD